VTKKKNPTRVITLQVPLEMLIFFNERYGLIGALKINCIGRLTLLLMKMPAEKEPTTQEGTEKVPKIGKTTKTKKERKHCVFAPFNYYNHLLISQN
jgi:hypothetical protein